MPTYAVKYARGKNHISGLSERVHTGMDSLNYAKTACAALSKSVHWCTGRSSENLAEVLEAARLHSGGRGVCLKCEATALAAIATDLGCPNPWHASAPTRMLATCPECPSHLTYGDLQIGRMVTNATTGEAGKIEELANGMVGVRLTAGPVPFGMLYIPGNEALTYWSKVVPKS